jgi:hypothetical protein
VVIHYDPIHVELKEVQSRTEYRLYVEPPNVVAPYGTHRRPRTVSVVARIRGQGRHDCLQVTVGLPFRMLQQPSQHEQMARIARLCNSLLYESKRQSLVDNFSHAILLGLKLNNTSFKTFELHKVKS